MIGTAKRATVGLFDRMPVVAIMVAEAFLIYAATGVAKVAFTQLDPLYAVWYRVGFMVLLMLAWRRPWQASKRDAMLLRRPAREWGLVVLLGFSLVLMNTMFYVAIGNMDMGIAVAIEFVGPLAVAVIAGNSWRERVGIVIAAVGVVLLAGISLSGAAGTGAGAGVAGAGASTAGAAAAGAGAGAVATGAPGTAAAGAGAGGSSGGNFLVGLVAILIGGSMWGVYIVTGRKVAARGASLDNLCVAVTIGWLMQSAFLAVPAMRHVIWPKPGATWAAAGPGHWGSVKLVALLFVISVAASFLPYVIEQALMRRTSAGGFSVMLAIDPAMAVAVGLVLGEIPSPGELAGVALVIVAVLVTFSGDKAPAPGD